MLAAFVPLLIFLMIRCVGPHGMAAAMSKTKRAVRVMAFWRGGVKSAVLIL